MSAAKSMTASAINYTREAAAIVVVLLSLETLEKEGLVIVTGRNPITDKGRREAVALIEGGFRITPEESDMAMNILACRGFRIQRRMHS